MSNFLSYLESEHARLETAISRERERRSSDDFEIARLKKLKLAVKDQITRWRTELETAA